MNKIKKTILTLVALLAVTTGAWAQEQWDVVWDFTAWSTETVTALKADAAASKLEGWSDVEKQADAEAGADPTDATKDNCFWSCSGTVNADGNLSANGAVIKEFQGLKFNSDYAAQRKLAIAVNYPSTSLGTYHGPAYLYLGGSNQTCFTIPGVKAGSKITIEVESDKTSSARGIGLYKNSYAAENLIGEQFTPKTFEAKTWEIAEDCNVVVYNTNRCHIYTIKVKAPAASSASAVTVDWDKAEKTGSFTMPGGNVELEPEYYPQAALTAAPTAINDVPATTDGAIVKPGTVKNIGETTTAQGTVMYYVSPSPLDDAALLALAADAWTADVPTAESLAEGQAYVYYYVRGNDSDTDDENFSDGDILAANALTVTIAAAPTYAVTFADGVNPEPPAEPEWTASPATDVKKGQTVTVTYTGSKKVLGVKAEKKAAAALIVNPAVGQIIGSDGKNYDANATLPDGVKAVAKIAYVGSDNGEAAPYNHGLALALSDANGGSGCKWNTENTDAGHTKQGSSTFTEESGLQYNDATHNSETYPAFKAAIANNGTAAPTGCSAWFLASGYQWQKMIDAVGLANLGLTEYAYYWSSSENDPDHAWDFEGAHDGDWSNSSKDYDDLVRACLAF